MTPPHAVSFFALALTLAFALAPAVAWGQGIDMRDTMHNLARGETMQTGDPRQICVFCHTPTDNDQSEAIRPLWQQSAPEGQSYPMFDDIGQMGKNGSAAVGSQSIACLSCHDSAQAFGVAGGSFDHPFAIPYRGALTPEQRKHAREEAVRLGNLINPAKQVNYDEGFRKASRGLVDNRPVWWVSKGAPSATRGRLDVPLYVRLDEEDQTEVPFVECASCHDPHNVLPQFLRAEADPTSLCMTCHIK